MKSTSMATYLWISIKSNLKKKSLAVQMNLNLNKVSNEWKGKDLNDSLKCVTITMLT